jgi:hypothetical protein
MSKGRETKSERAQIAKCYKLEMGVKAKWRKTNGLKGRVG